MNGDDQQAAADYNAANPKPKGWTNVGKKKESVLDLPVNFGSVNIGDKIARIGVTVDRSSLKLSDADKQLCERRLTGTITGLPPDESSDQGRLNGMEDVGITKMSGVFDVKGISVTSEHISLGLSFAINSIKVEDLAHFAKRSGRLIVTDVDDLPDDEDKEEPE